MYHLHPGIFTEQVQVCKSCMGTSQNRGWGAERVLLDLRARNECCNHSEQQDWRICWPYGVGVGSLSWTSVVVGVLATHGHRASPALLLMIPRWNVLLCIHLLCRVCTWVNHVQHHNLSKQAHLTSSDHFCVSHLESDSTTVEYLHGKVALTMGACSGAVSRLL